MIRMKTILTFPLPHSQPYLALLYSSLSKNKYHIFYSKEYMEQIPSSYDSITGINLQEFENHQYAYKALILYNQLQAFDIVHFHWIEYIYLSHSGFIKKIIAIFSFIILTFYMRYIIHTKIVITFHNVESHNQFNPKLEKMLFKYCIRCAHAIIVHNEYSKEFLVSHYDQNQAYKKKFHIIPHGNYSSYYSNTISQKDARKTLSLPSDAFVLLMFGEMRPEVKGIEDVILMLKKNMKTIRKSKLYFLFAGKPKSQDIPRDIETIAALYPDHIQYNFQYIPDEDVQVYLNACDVGILPYRRISTSGVLMLYLSFGKPVIVSQLSPFVELLGEEYSLYCEPQNPVSLMRTIEKARNMSLSDVSRSYKNVINCYNWDKIAKATEHVYDAL